MFLLPHALNPKIQRRDEDAITELSKEDIEAEPEIVDARMDLEFLRDLEHLGQVEVPNWPFRGLPEEGLHVILFLGPRFMEMAMCWGLQIGFRIKGGFGLGFGVSGSGWLVRVLFHNSVVQCL